MKTKIHERGMRHEAESRGVTHTRGPLPHRSVPALWFRFHLVQGDKTQENE